MDKILILKIGAIGDVVMASSMLPFLKENQDCHITWIVGKTAAPILAAAQMVDELIVVDDQKLFKGSYFQRILEIFKLWKKIGFSRFDLAVSCHVDIRYRLLLMPVFKKTFRFFSRKKKYISGRYHASEYIRLLTDAEGPFCNPIQFPKLQDSFPEHLISLFSNTRKKIAILPGGAQNILATNAQRRWPIVNYVRLAENLQKDGHQILLIGASSDAWTLPFFEKMDTINLIGKTELLELVSILKRVDLLITHDSGPLHLAKLAGCQTIALFGPTQPSEFLGHEPNIHYIWGGKDLSCRPCYDGKHFAKCNRNLCMEDITVEEVLTLAKKVVASQKLNCFSFSSSSCLSFSSSDCSLQR
ncbi:MAG TPA: glycosyltransferase family 9 protein [Chlamydiales bacterium]|nr:glycosyltransferase family 9 protein [Chlamydiales bacterium]